MNQNEFVLKITQITDVAEKEVKSLMELIAPKSKKLATLSGARALIIEGLAAKLGNTTKQQKISGSKAIYTVYQKLILQGDENG